MIKRTAIISFLTISCFFMGLWLPCQASDDTIYVCKNNKTGTPRLVSDPSKCKTTTEHLVTLNSCMQGPQGPQGPQGLQGPQGPTGFTGASVYDDNNQFLGYVDHYSPGYDGIKIYIPSLKNFIGIVTSTVGSLPVGEVLSAGLYFQSSDCSGKPYISMDAAHGIVKVAGKYYTGKSMHMFEPDVHSFWDSYNSICLNLSWEPGGLVELTEEISLPFNTPVALPLRIE